MAEGTKQLLISLGGAAFAITLAANAFFVKRLVDEIDETKRIALDVQSDLKILRVEIGVADRAESFVGHETRVKF